MKNKIGKVALLSILTISLVGCGKVPKLKNGEEVVVNTKEGKITANDLYDALKSKYGNEILLDLIDHTILDEKYESGDDEDSYVDEQMASVESAASQYGLSLNQYATAVGFDSIDAIKEYFRLSYKRDTAVDDYVKDTISDSEIKDYYNDVIAEDINCKHILISNDDEDAYETAKKVIKELDKGKDFDELAKKYSTDDATKDNGGDLGYFNKGEMTKNFEDAAYALKKGEYSKEPVLTNYGYHIIYKVDQKDKPKLKEVKNDIIDKLVDKKLSEDSTLYYNALQSIRKDNGLDIVDDDLAKDYKSYMDKLTTPSRN